MYQSDGSGASEVLEAEVRVRLERARAPHEDRGAARLLVERGGRLRARHHRLRVCAGVGARARRDPDDDETAHCNIVFCIQLNYCTSLRGAFAFHRKCE